MREQTLPRQAQVVLTATKHAVGIRCVDLGHVVLQLHFTCSTLLLSFEVRACCDSAVDFTGKKVVSVVAIFKIEVGHDFYVTRQRIMHFLGCFSTSRELEESSLCRFTVADGCLHRRAESNFRFIPVAQTQLVSFHFTQTFPEKVLVVSNYAMLKSFVQRKKKQSFLTFDCM